MDLLIRAIRRKCIMLRGFPRVPEHLIPSDEMPGPHKLQNHSDGFGPIGLTGFDGGQ